MRTQTNFEHELRTKYEAGVSAMFGAEADISRRADGSYLSVRTQEGWELYSSVEYHHAQEELKAKAAAQEAAEHLANEKALAERAIYAALNRFSEHCGGVPYQIYPEIVHAANGRWRCLGVILHTGKI